MNLTLFEDDKESDPDFDFSSPEDVLIYVIEEPSSNRDTNWSGFFIEACTVINGKSEVYGAASYEYSFGGFLEETLMDLVECPKKEGYYVVEGIIGTVIKGDGWTSDDDMKFYHSGIRPATDAEIVMM